MRSRLFILIVVATLISVNTWACRYSVRDTGFVDIGDDHYRLILQGSNLGDLAGIYRGISAASLLDSNIAFEVEEASDNSESTLRLIAADGRELVLASGQDLPTDIAGAAELIESVSMSPLRSEIHELCLKSFAVVILVEGALPTENARLKTSIEAAISDIEQLMPSMPKPVDTPPALIRIDRARAIQERVALWGLGLDPESANEARVSIVYGRGRRLGEPLEGPLVTRTALQERLSIIGQDCECELDRKWMKGQMFPGRWDSDRQRDAVRLLGFDPENPMIRSEVSRIVLRGPAAGQTRKLSGPSSTFGYTEVLVDEIPLAESESSIVPRVPSQPDTTPSPATLATSTPLEQTSRITWVIVLVLTATMIATATIMWRRIRKDQG